MAETKYGKYFISGPFPGTEEMKIIASLSGDQIQGCNRYLVNWMTSSPAALFGVESWDQISHSPHIHKSAEILMHLGTNPDAPYDLGAEIEFCMGPEMEKHTITKSTVTYIPPNFIHGPWRVKRVDRPFLIIQVNQEPTHTEKSLKELVPAEDMDKTMCLDEGYESKEAVWKFPKGSTRAQQQQ